MFRDRCVGASHGLEKKELIRPIRWRKMSRERGGEKLKAIFHHPFGTVDFLAH